MTPEQKIKYLMLAVSARWQKMPAPDYSAMTGDDIDAAYEALVSEDRHWDAKSETREGEVETGLPADGGRHYEAKAVAARLPDGSWVGWTYYYGGGKHSDPDSIDWMDDAYDLSCTEEVKTMTVRTFSQVK